MSGDDEIINDDPSLYYTHTNTWARPPVGAKDNGHGDNGFRFTWAIGGSEDNDTYAKWNFFDLNGRFEVEAWIPDVWATADVQYHIWVDTNGNSIFESEENIASPRLDQAEAKGWQSLGDHSLLGDVRIRINDSESNDNYLEDGPENARIVVDAIRLTRVGDFTAPTTTIAPAVDTTQ